MCRIMKGLFCRMVYKVDKEGLFVGLINQHRYLYSSFSYLLVHQSPLD